ncbi:MAG: hypothetical protein IT173_11110 [Acidobacteria bacterium]|nr:hypothetical protein [Acidobacteriota bacterium]
MIQTIEAEIDVNGNVRLLETIRLTQPRRALLTVLEEEPKVKNHRTRASSRELSEALDEAYANDKDEDEKEFLRLAKVKQLRILDEWK